MSPLIMLYCTAAAWCVAVAAAGSRRLGVAGDGSRYLCEWNQMLRTSRRLALGE